MWSMLTYANCNVHGEIEERISWKYYDENFMDMMLNGRNILVRVENFGVYVWEWLLALLIMKGDYLNLV